MKSWDVGCSPDSLVVGIALEYDKSRFGKAVIEEEFEAVDPINSMGNNSIFASFDVLTIANLSNFGKGVWIFGIFSRVFEVGFFVGFRRFGNRIFENVVSFIVEVDGSGDA